MNPDLLSHIEKFNSLSPKEKQLCKYFYVLQRHKVEAGQWRCIRVGMTRIATKCGCSRRTVIRFFKNNFGFIRKISCPTRFGKNETNIFEIDTKFMRMMKFLDKNKLLETTKKRLNSFVHKCRICHSDGQICHPILLDPIPVSDKRMPDGKELALNKLKELPVQAIEAMVPIIFRVGKSGCMKLRRVRVDQLSNPRGYFYKTFYNEFRSLPKSKRS